MDRCPLSIQAIDRLLAYSNEFIRDSVSNLNGGRTKNQSRFHHFVS